jgi:hypothetical protein
VILPVEIVGNDGTTVSRGIELSDEERASARALWLRVHGVRYPEQASIEINGGPWIPLRNDTVTVAEPGKRFGGVGGAFATLELTLPLQSSALVSGTNTVRFRFNESDGLASGYRVLALNFLRREGARILPPSAFAEDSPDTWSPPHSDEASIRTGRNLWLHAPLIASSVQNSPAIKARCADCHAQDGRDLKYFNFSNGSIIARSRFHGLTALEGEQIASYIRSLNVPNPGRPWNPPYQPGPGTDQQADANWAAGAGLEWVLDDDSRGLTYLMEAQTRLPRSAPTERIDSADLLSLVPRISPSIFDPDGDLNAREVPVALQLPDWSQWLPRIHPMDAWGNAFGHSEFAAMYDGGDKAERKRSLRSMLAHAAIRDADLHLVVPAFSRWTRARNAFLSHYASAKAKWSPELTNKVYSTQLWQLIKTWELTQEFGLELKGARLVGDGAEPRTWCNTIPADTAPAQGRIPNGPAGVGGSGLNNEYLSASWYELQIILNSGNHRHRDRTPVDWIYLIGHFNELYVLSHEPEPVRLLVAVIKALQSTDPRASPADLEQGWRPERGIDPRIMISPRWAAEFSPLPLEVRRAVTESMLSAWMNKNLQYSLAEYLPIPTPPQDYKPPNVYSDISGGRAWQASQQFGAAGVSEEVVAGLENWGIAYMDCAVRLQYH